MGDKCGKFPFRQWRWFGYCSRTVFLYVHPHKKILVSDIVDKTKQNKKKVFKYFFLTQKKMMMMIKQLPWIDNSANGKKPECLIDRKKRINHRRMKHLDVLFFFVSHSLLMYRISFCTLIIIIIIYARFKQTKHLYICTWILTV